ncbi:hypothetical protein [Kitasatospora arboriphila]|uniref:Uncharacterized protein n=1 Tax=Kitasatospora arboriphila TaxID=258052 RepID=A0ABN1TNN0_9ACTN
MRTGDHRRSRRDRTRFPPLRPDRPLDRGNGGQDPSQGILEATEQVARLLKASGHRFALAGSVASYASYAHGVPRRTWPSTATRTRAPSTA